VRAFAARKALWADITTHARAALQPRAALKSSGARRALRAVIADIALIADNTRRAGHTRVAEIGLQLPVERIRRRVVCVREDARVAHARVHDDIIHCVSRACAPNAARHER
jgi:hypothetical protein